MYSAFEYFQCRAYCDSTASSQDGAWAEWAHVCSEIWQRKLSSACKKHAEILRVTLIWSHMFVVKISEIYNQLQFGWGFSLFNRLYWQVFLGCDSENTLIIHYIFRRIPMMWYFLWVCFSHESKSQAYLWDLERISRKDHLRFFQSFVASVFKTSLLFCCGVLGGTFAIKCKHAWFCCVSL